jgi:hypothetical protein
MITTSAGPADSLAAAAASGQGVVAWYAQGFSDRLGDRLLLFDNTGAPPLELLRLAERLTTHAGFEPALRDQVEKLKPLRHPAFARVRGVTVLSEPVPQLALVSEHIPGERLSTILRAAESARFRPDPSTGIWLVRQLLSALGALHAMGTGIAHGLLSPERIVVTPGGDLVITEYVLGQALDRIAAPRELWQTLGVALDPEIENERRLVQVDPGKDVQQVALLALAVLLGRPLREGEYPSRVGTLLDDACDRARWSFVGPLRAWLARALAEKAEWRFSSSGEAVTMLDTLVPQIKGTWSPSLLPQAILTRASETGGAGTDAGATPLLASAPLGGRQDLHEQEVRRHSTPAPALEARGTARLLVAEPEVRPADAPSSGWQWITAGIRARGLLFAGLAGAEAIALLLLLGRPAPMLPPVSAPVQTITAGTLPAAATPPPVDAGGAGWITVTARQDLDVRIAGQARSRGRHTRIPLPAGPHRVIVIDPGTGASQAIDVQVVAGQGVALEPDFAGRGR